LVDQSALGADAPGRASPGASRKGVESHLASVALVMLAAIAIASLAAVVALRWLCGLER
jgi:hypothetical protein